MPITEAHKRAMKKYLSKEEVKEVQKVKTYRRSAKLYISKYATEEDMKEFNELFKKNNKKS